MTQGIYKLEINGIYYIGKDSHIDKEKRYKHHLSLLKNKKHFNKHLQRAFDKYDELNYSVLIEFKEIDQETLNKAEMFYIDLFESMENGFNQTIGGDGVQGREKTKEEIEKIRQTKLNGFINNVYSRTTGETNGMNILSEKDVIEIVSYFYKMEKSDTELAKMYGVGRQTINTIHNGKRWSYLQEVKDWLKFKEENNHKFRRQGSNTLFPIEIYEIKHLLKAGFDKKEISQLYNTSTTTVHRIMKNQAYTDIDTSKPYSYYKL